MANPEHLEEQREETRLIIEELLEDGSDPDALYTIEHHLSADDFETLEKVAVEAFKLGYEVTEPEELEVEEGDMVICCDILSECALNADLIDAQVEQLMTLAEKYDVEYDGGVPIMRTRTVKKTATMTKILSMKTTMVFAISCRWIRRRLPPYSKELPWITRRYSPDYQLPALPDTAGVD
ncbi:ribonuclease E inhibitor RraB [Klebsiella variicola]|nr:ribonuclease E inhibitor RraB [Klebsiella variicola]